MTTKIKSIATIDSIKIKAALEKAKPVTVAGRAAISNFNQYMLSNALTAIGLELAINEMQSLYNNNAEVGVEALLGTLKGLMPREKRQVAVAYEAMQIQEDNSIFNVQRDDAFRALSDLYQLNSTKIIRAIAVDGVLDTFATNPVIAKLINYAKSAVNAVNKAGQPMPFSNVEGENVTVTLMPILNIAQLDDNTVIRLAGKLFMLGKRGKLSPIASVSDLSLSGDVSRLLSVLNNYTVTTEPNVITLLPDMASVAAKDLGIRDLKFDLLANIDNFVIINGTPMSVDKAKSLIQANSPAIVAATMLNPDAKMVLDIINESMTMFANYRDALLSNQYAKRIAVDDIAYNIVKFDNSYSMLVTKGSETMSIKSFDDIMQLLADDAVIAAPVIHNAITAAYMSDIEAAQSKSNVKMSVIAKLIDEKAEYAQLLEKIMSNQTELEAMPDANPEKLKALKELKAKTTANLAHVNDELSKLQD